MQRLIDANALEKAIYEWMPKDQEAWMDSDLPPIENLVVSIMMTIEEQPTVEPSGLTGWVCPICGRGLSPFTSVCPCQGGKGWEITCG